MPNSLPIVVARLLDASDAAARDAAWGEFVAAHSRLIFHVARGFGGERDVIMDRYTYVLDHLRVDDFRRIRAFVADGRSEFSTWLVVVAQHACLDHRRQRYGRIRRVDDGASPDADEDRAARRRLVDLISADVDLSSLSDGARTGEDALRETELYGALEAALETLPARDRLMVKLRFEDDLPMSELSRNLGFPNRFQAYRHLTEILRGLRRALERAGIRDTVP
jgi:RNA polymerase sigma factor (sigma-70 family)